MFDSIGDCFDRHAAVITRGKPYAVAWAEFQECRDVAQLINGIAGVYATDPAYVTKLRRLISMPEVKSAITAQQALGPSTADPSVRAVE
jgi:flagellum-specific peptidoglycan hydrolase FlgJ